MEHLADSPVTVTMQNHQQFYTMYNMIGQTRLTQACQTICINSLGMYNIVSEGNKVAICILPQGHYSW